MFRKLRPNNDWDHYRQAFQWDDAGACAAVAWSKFRPEHLKGKDGGIGALAHVRFPLGGYHMVLQSDDPELIREHLPTAWAIASTVDLEQIAAGRPTTSSRSSGSISMHSTSGTPSCSNPEHGSATSQLGHSSFDPMPPTTPLARLLIALLSLLLTELTVDDPGH